MGRSGPSVSSSAGNGDGDRTPGTEIGGADSSLVVVVVVLVAASSEVDAAVVADSVPEVLVETGALLGWLPLLVVLLPMAGSTSYLGGVGGLSWVSYQEGSGRSTKSGGGWRWATSSGATRFSMFVRCMTGAVPVLAPAEPAPEPGPGGARGAEDGGWWWREQAQGSSCGCGRDVDVDVDVGVDVDTGGGACC